MAKFLESSAQAALADDLRARVERSLGTQVIDWRRPDTGLTAAQRYLVKLADGSGAFVKAATDEATAAWLRNEHLALSAAPRALVPRVLAWEDGSTDFPVLVTEDLSAAHWPASHSGVEWRPGDIDLVFEALDELRHAHPPAAIPRSEHTAASTWADIERAPRAFLDLKLCSEQWLNGSIAALRSAEAGHDPSGEAWVHGDLRSDNICIAAGRAVFVDWSSSRRGDPLTDLAEWLPTLYLEGGPEPFSVLRDGAWAASVAARQARQATSEANAPAWLQRVFRRLVAIDLAWAAKCLELPPPDGPFGA